VTPQFRISRWTVNTACEMQSGTPWWHGPCWGGDVHREGDAGWRPVTPQVGRAQRAFGNANDRFARYHNDVPRQARVKKSSVHGCRCWPCPAHQEASRYARLGRGLQQMFAGNTLRDSARKLLATVGLMQADASVRNCAQDPSGRSWQSRGAQHQFPM
jgi:hypothetical protein